MGNGLALKLSVLLSQLTLTGRNVGPTELKYCLAHPELWLNYKRGKCFFKQTKTFFFFFFSSDWRNNSNWETNYAVWKKNSYAYKIAQFSTTTPILLVVWLTAEEKMTPTLVAAECRGSCQCVPVARPRLAEPGKCRAWQRCRTGSLRHHPSHPLLGSRRQT